jgi:aminopeptidase N
MEGGGGQLCSWAQYRLPSAVVPLYYNLTLNVTMAAPFPVTGEVAIAVNVTQDTHCVVLHGAEMEVEEVRLGGSNGQIGKVTARPEREQLILEFSEALPRQGAMLWLSFRYNLRVGLAGFYRSTYTLADGKQRSLATTQFEAAAARLAFPCFDEPAFKAVFDVEVIAPAPLTVLSNSLPRGVHEHEANKQAGTRTWHFKPTPHMSTYLVCVIVGEFASTSQLVKAGAAGSVNVSVWGTPDRVKNLQYAADSAAAILPAYQAALGVPYPLEKLDLVAIPDFSAGAMENWGVVTYREEALLASPSSSLLDLRYVTQVVAHELAHQWFGNLVTMHWWSELWLNEGFASYWEYVGATAAHADYGYFATFYSENVPRALFLDSKRASHALSLDPAAVNSVEMIESMFDSISYQKGAAVLRMLRAWANRSNKQMPLPTFETVPGATPKQDALLAGLGQYLQQHQYHVTQAVDLWAMLSGPLGFDVPKAMLSWTYQQGYPVVTAQVDKNLRVWLLQAPFSLAGIGQCDPSTAWWIPVSFQTSDDPGRLQWAELSSCSSEKPLVTL